MAERSLYRAADALEYGARKLDRGAFFSSIHGTLNHIFWNDRTWRNRSAGSAKPTQPNSAGSVEEGGDWPDLKSAREQMDQAIID